MLIPTFYQDIQREIDRLGHVGHDDIVGSPLRPEDMYHAPVPVHDESDWYQNFMFVGEDRLQRYRDFEDSDTHPLTSSALDIYGEEATQRDAWGNVVQVITPDQVIKDELNELLFRRLNINHALYRIVRDTCKYGDKFQYAVMEKNRKGILFLKDLPVHSVWRLEWNGKIIAFVQQTPQGITPPLDPFSVVHWRIAINQQNYRPYGTSIMDPCRRHIRQLKLMEDSMVVYRITRAPERRVFFVNCGRLPPAKAESYMRQIIHRFRKRSIINPGTGEIDWRSNPLAPDEDFYVPVRDGTDGTRIQQLEGAKNLGEIDDVIWFKDQILSYLKIPRVYLQDANGGPAERRENLAMQDIRFARTIERVQGQILEGLTKICIVHLLLRGYPKQRAMSFMIQSTCPSFAHERAQQEVEVARLGLSDQYLNAGFPRRYAWEKVLKLTGTEINKLISRRRKEDLVLAEREAQVGAYREKATVYWQERYAEKFGVEDDQGDVPQAPNAPPSADAAPGGRQGQGGERGAAGGEKEREKVLYAPPHEPYDSTGQRVEPGTPPKASDAPKAPDVISRTTASQSTTRKKEQGEGEGEPEQGSPLPVQPSHAAPQDLHSPDAVHPDLIGDPGGVLKRSPASQMAAARAARPTRAQIEEGMAGIRREILGEDGEALRGQILFGGATESSDAADESRVDEDIARRPRGATTSCHLELLARGEFLPISMTGGLETLKTNGAATAPMPEPVDAFRKLQKAQRADWLSGKPEEQEHAEG